MDTQKDQIVERLKQATNILVTVSNNPSVDQLAAAIGFTLLLNKTGKHGTAVFSGAVPSTIQFLQPDKTLEKNTDSLRDFIIALDKSKADKLRYKVEDQMVKIFITPYMTSISDKDLEFSQGDFNVDVVLALGVKEQQDLDLAITAHGRILHDATVIAVSTQEGTSLGSINWVDPAASSLSEMLTYLGLALKADVLDGQIATALLTGIVAETNRFSNEKTSSETMQLSAKLMDAGANQQLVASQLQAPTEEVSKPNEGSTGSDELPAIEEPVEAPKAPDQAAGPDPEPKEPESPKPADGTLQISHGQTPEPDTTQVADDDSPEASEEPTEEVQPAEEEMDQIHIDENGHLKPLNDEPAPKEAEQMPTAETSNGRFLQEPPSHTGTLTSNLTAEEQEPSADLLGGVPPAEDRGSLLKHDTVSPDDSSTSPAEVADAETVPLPEVPAFEPSPIIPAIPAQDDHSQTLAELEQAVVAGHVPAQAEESKPSDPESNMIPVESQSTADVISAQDAVSQALQGTPPQILNPIQSLNAHPMDLNLGDMPAVATSLESAFAQTSSSPDLTPVQPASEGVIAPDPGSPPPLLPLEPPPSDMKPEEPQDPNAPPPVPPPLSGIL